MIIRGDATRIPLPDCSVDAVVTDPPYGLEFMGKEWDSFRVDDPGTARHRGERAGGQGTRGGQDRWQGDDGRSIPASRVNYGGGKRPTTNRCVGCGKRDQFRNAHACPDGTSWRVEIIDPHSAPPSSLAFQEWCRIWATECLRVLKPGGHLLAFGGTRTYHRMTCAIEDAGFEVRDCLVWLYGSGFPKSLDVSKALDKMAGAEREITGYRESMGYPDGGTAYESNRTAGSSIGADLGPGGPPITAPATPEAEQWQGFGTALKPAFEPVVLARKPLTGTVAQNVLRWGTGALNVDGCRVGDDPGYSYPNGPGGCQSGEFHYQDRATTPAQSNPAGRWPPNVAMDEEAARLLDEQSGERSYNPPSQYIDGIEGAPGTRAFGKGVGRYEAGQERGGYGDTGGASRFMYVAKASSAERNRGLVKPSSHPTVKPLALMRWLVRLVTPPNGLVLDPFLGSGTTLLACAHEGMRGIGIEREAEYVEIAKGRLSQPIQGGML